MKKILTQEKFENKVYEKFGNSYTVIGQYCGCHNRVKIRCNKCGNEWDIDPKFLFSDRFVGCKCEQNGNTKSNETFLNQLSNLSSQCIPLEEYKGQDTEIRFKCLVCGEVFTQTPKKFLNQLKTSNKPCPRCGETVSFPEKFFYSFLKQLNCDFVYQYNRSNGGDWCKNYLYDFYIPSEKLIIETHGLQHYRQTTFGNIDEIQENDQNKMELAIRNNVNYIVIDCRRSSGEYIKNNIVRSDLSQIFDLSNIDWGLCNSYASKPIFDTVCDIYRLNNYSYSDIAEQVPISPETVGKYIRSAIQLGLLEKKDWRTDKHKKGIKIHCVELNMDFSSIAKANIYLNKKRTNCSIHSCLKGITKTAFGYHWYKITA